MQEEIESRTVTISVNTAKLTARTLKQALSKFLAYQKNKHIQNYQTKDVVHHGKQTVKQLAAHNQGLTSIEITNKNIKDFDRVARKYGVDYAVKKDKTVKPPNYLVFFKAKDNDALTAAFREYTANTIKKKDRKESVVTKLQEILKNIKDLPNKKKHKELEL